MAPRRHSWRAGQRQRATVAIGAAAVLLAQLGLAYVAGDRYQAAIGRALNQFTDVSSPEAPPVGPPLRVAGSRDADAVPTPDDTLAGRTVALGPTAVPPPVETVGTAPGPSPLPQPSPQPSPAVAGGDDAEEPQAGGAEPPRQVERDSVGDEGGRPDGDEDGRDSGGVRDEGDRGGRDRDDGKGDGEQEEGEEERGRLRRASASSHSCSTSRSERDDERDEACEERGRDQRDERDESRVDGRGKEDEHRSSSAPRTD